MIVVETRRPDGTPVAPAVAAAVESGVNCIQLRDHATLPDDLRATALAIRSAVRDSAKIIINDAPEIARELCLDGLQLPEAAFPPSREEFGCRLLIGRSVHSVEGALRAQAEGADYIVAGNIFESRAHSGRDWMGTDFLNAICRSVQIPVIAIGGITPETVGECIAAGACGVATQSRIINAPDPGVVARRYAEALHAAWPLK